MITKLDEIIDEIGTATFAVSVVVLAVIIVAYTIIKIRWYTKR